MKEISTEPCPICGKDKSMGIFRCWKCHTRVSNIDVPLHIPKVQRIKYKIGIISKRFKETK